MQELATHPQTPQADPKGRTGSLFAGRYRIEAALARGGMGQVWRAVQAPLGRPVALKLLSPSALQAGYGRRFFLEAATVARLTHPHIVTLLDYGRAPSGTYFIAMELLAGQSLRAALDGARQAALGLGLARALSVARQIARALRQAHRLGVAHRDLKPANVFLCRVGDEEDFVKVLDFGLAKVRIEALLATGNNPPTLEALTRHGTVFGTPTYMAPEQGVGGEVDGRTDLYALGIIMYELLTGKPPFLGEDPSELLKQHVIGKVPAFADRAPALKVPAALEHLIMQLLEKRPKASERGACGAVCHRAD